MGRANEDVHEKNLRDLLQSSNNEDTTGTSIAIGVKSKEDNSTTCTNGSLLIPWETTEYKGAGLSMHTKKSMPTLTAE